MAGTFRLLVLGVLSSALPADPRLQNRFKVISSLQHGFPKGKPCLTSLITP